MNRLKNFFWVLLLSSAAILVENFSHAGELKVDINRDSKNSDGNTEVSYTKWSTASAYSTTGTAVTSSTFTNAGGEVITIGFSQTATSQARGGTGLLTDWNSVGVVVARLVSDGFSVNPKTLATGAEIQMTIMGLANGHHTLLTYHNHTDNLTNGSIAPIDVYVNGALKVDNLLLSIRLTNTMLCPVAYLEFDVTNTTDVTTILFASETNSAAPIKNFFINGFEIDTPNFIRAANSPSPQDGEEHVDVSAGSLVLTWGAAIASNAVSHDVYFGMNQTSVKNATRVSPEFKSNQAGTNYTVNSLNSLLTYYWRIDEVDVIGNITKGTVWMFRPRHLAFPGAEGYGRFARGGRGGVVVHVTNTNDSGAGSFRDAIEGNYGPRTVVFDVSGLITLNTDIIIGSAQPYITIAGQTAPGKGICFKRQQFGLSGARDCIIRYVRIFVGKESGETQNATGMAGVDHCIMDHCSFGWGIDEAISSRSAKNMTLQRSFCSEMLNIAGHQNYPAGTEHGYAASIGGEVASFHHNLLAHNEGRNWSLAGGLDPSGFFAGSLDIFNNVVYNWGGRTTDGGTHRCNFVNNYYKPGAGSTIFWALRAQYDNFPGTQQYYFAGNVMPGYFQVGNQTAGRTAVNGTGTVPVTYSPWTNSPFFPSYATIDEVTNAYKKVLSDVGCNQPMVDDHDKRIIRETMDGTFTYTGTGAYGGRAGMPNTTDDVGGWEDYGNAVRPANWDTDNDGLPDWWEAIKGFNPNSASGDFSESNVDPDGDGYTAFEDYLNWMAAPHSDCNVSSFVDIDLTALTCGFTNNAPRYGVFGALNGTVITNGNGRTARFTANVSTNALAGFTFSVVDANGYNMTNTIGIRVVAAVANTAPIFTATPSNCTINVGANLVITNTASDANSGQVLTYTLPVKPTNAGINASSGMVNWRPLVTQANSTNPFSVVVSDNGSLSLSATQNFSIIVNPLSAPVIATPTLGAGQISLSIGGQVGPDYAVQASSNLVDWRTLLITNPAGMPFSWSTNAGGLPAQYYRIQVGPPLP